MLRNGLRPVEDKNGKYGYMNAAGKPVVPYIYDGAENFREGLGVVCKDKKWGAIDPSGKLVIPIIYYRLNGFERGICVASIKKGDKEIFGIIDKRGDIVVPFLYDWMELNGLPEDGLVKVSRRVTQNGKADLKHGFIDLRGNTVVPLEFDDLDQFSEGLAWFKKTGKFGFVDKSGNIRIEAVYDEAKGFREGLAAVKKDGKWGFIDPTGKVVIGFKYYAVPPDEYKQQAGFIEGIAVVGKGWYSKWEPYWGYIDKTGRELTEFKYYSAYPAKDGILSVSTYGDGGRRSGLLNKEGKVVVPFADCYIGIFYNGRARIVTEAKNNQNAIGYIDKTGRIVISMKYTVSGDFDGSTTVPEYARVSTSYVSITGQMSNPRFFTIDREGKVVKPYGFDSISNFNSGVAAAYDITGQKTIAFIIDKSWKYPEPAAGTQNVRFPCSRLKMLVDGRPFDLESYTITGKSYIKPRDFAKALDGTAAQFDVAWDGAKKVFNLTTGKKYTPIGGELSPGDGAARSALPSTSGIRINGLKTEFLPVSIAGSDYFILDELAALVGVSAGRDAQSKAINLNTAAADKKRMIYRIITRVNDRNAIGISGSSTESGAKAITWDNDFTVKVQEFAFVPVGDKYCILSVHSGKALTAENKKGTVVSLQPYNGSDGQLFMIEEALEDFVSIKTSFGFYLGVSGGNRQRGTPIITWDSTDNSSQHFRLTRID